jgi:hypothetical protein
MLNFGTPSFCVRVSETGGNGFCLKIKPTIINVMLHAKYIDDDWWSFVVLKDTVLVGLLQHNYRMQALLPYAKFCYPMPLCCTT